MANLICSGRPFTKPQQTFGAPRPNFAENMVEFPVILSISATFLSAMSTKRILILTAAFSLAASGAGAGDFISAGKVVHSTPIIETVLEPVEECRYELRRIGGGGNSTDPTNRIIGGILGGAAGSAFGKGGGKDAAAAAGAVLGSEVGAQDGELSGGELLGGAAGGIIGNQLGSGSGKTAATAAGALLGSLLGDELQHGEDRRRKAAANAKYRKTRVCSYTEREKKVITGYTVVYEYAGRQFSGVLPYKPGATVDIQVSAQLIENRATRLETDN